MPTAAAAPKASGIEAGTSSVRIVPSAPNRYEPPTPASTPTIAGWQSMADWQHADYVHGSSSPQPVDVLRQNLQLLHGMVDYANYPAPNDYGQGLRGYRKWRWLWYTNVKDAMPKLIYTLVEPEEVSLPNAYDNEHGVQRWLVYDLNSARGLYPGVLYALSGVQCAFEDVNA